METLKNLPAGPLADEARVTPYVAAGAAAAPRWIGLRLLVEPKFRSRVVNFALRNPTPLETRDRWILERMILPWYAAKPGRLRVVFVGCDYYTWHYERVFRDHDYATIEPIPSQSRFGARNHVMDCMENLDQYFEPGSVDLILCNGVVGVGLDRREDAEKAFSACATALKPGGQLMLGYNDVPLRTPYDPLSLDAMQAFRLAEFPPLGASVYLTPTEYRHTYAFLERLPPIRPA
jgi:hypothetical protein